MTTINDIEQLFRNNFKAMLTYANRLVHDEDSARDIVHDVFASLLLNKPVNVSTAYLFNGVRYACLNHIRDLSLRQRLHNLYAYEMEDVENEGSIDNDSEWLNKVIERSLTEQNQRIIRLRFTERLTYHEIGEALGISEVAVYKHLSHALNILHQKFKEHEG